ncbi:MAG: DUF59 domain-containing protein [Proteobacteria bacterium]|nr:DUF59 domain-containing protein [Pseudomonadota bacterium]
MSENEISGTQAFITDPDVGYDISPIREHIIKTLQTLYDPEIPVNIYDLGLIYELGFSKDHGICIRMTLTTPHCPVAQSLPQEVKAAIEALPDIAYAHVEVVWDPPWSSDRMSDAAKLQLGML